MRCVLTIDGLGRIVLLNHNLVVNVFEKIISTMIYEKVLTTWFTTETWFSMDASGLGRIQLFLFNSLEWFGLDKDGIGDVINPNNEDIG